MNRRKFNLGDIIRKLNEDNPSSQPDTGHAPSNAENTSSPSSQSAKQSHEIPVPSSHDPRLPSQPEYSSGLRSPLFPPEEKKSSANTTHPQRGKAALTRDEFTASPGTQQDHEPVYPEQQPPPSDAASPPSLSLPSSLTQLDEDEDESDFDLFKYIGILLRRKYIILFIILLSAIFSLTKYMRSDTYYVASARLLFRPDNQEIISPKKGFRYWGDRENIFNTHLELLKSRTVLSIVAQNIDTVITPELIQSGLVITQGEINGEKNDIIEITFKHYASETARDVLNELCRSYIDYRRDVNTQEVTRLVNKFEYQIDKIEGELDTRETTLREFKESHRMVELSNETNLTISKLSTMEMELQQTQLSLLENKERLGALTTQISRQEQDIVQSVTYQDPFKNRISELELELSTLTSEYSAEHFKVKNLRQQIESLKAATVDSLTKKAASRTLVKNPIRQTLLQELINVTIQKAALDAKRTAQERLIDKLNQELVKLPAVEQQYANLQRETESLLQTLRMLKTRYEEAKIRRDSEESDLKLLELAQTPEFPRSTGRPRNIIVGILIGIFIGIALALLVEYLDQSLKDPTSVEKLLGLPLLGIVPFIEADHALLEQITDLTKNILEPFRALRANIKHIATTHRLQTFIICSAIKGEGKTTLGANLAITFALDGKRVILVDGDLRRSQVHTLFGISKTTGLSDYLLGTATVDDILKPTRIENMHLVTSGERPNNPAELLGTVRFDQLMSDLRKKADIIIFDSPALLPVSDTITMAPKMDGVLFVVRTFWTPIKAAKQALNQLERIGSKLYGGVLNGASHSGKRYPYYYGYYGYYGYYSYKYSYEDDRQEKLSPRTVGLLIEKKVKAGLHSVMLGMPKFISDINREAAKISKRKRFWVLLLALVAVSAIRVYIRHTNPFTVPQQVEYIGLTSTPTPDSTTQITYNDIAFTKNKGSVPTTATADTNGLHAAVQAWYTALSENNHEAYLGWYDQKSFRYRGGGFAQWKEQCSTQFVADSQMEYGELDRIRLLPDNKGHTALILKYQVVTKEGPAVTSLTSTWSKVSGTWRITTEKQLSFTQRSPGED